jgi:hypothetical protein
MVESDSSTLLFSFFILLGYGTTQSDRWLLTGSTTVHTWVCQEFGSLVLHSIIPLNYYSCSSLVVRVPGYRSRDPWFDSRCYQIFWEVMGLEGGPLSLVRITHISGIVLSKNKMLYSIKLFLSVKVEFDLYRTWTERRDWTPDWRNNFTEA